MKSYLFVKTKNGLQASYGGETILIQSFGKDCLRVQATLNKGFFDYDQWLLPPPYTPIDFHIHKDYACIINGEIMATINVDGSIRFSTVQGVTLLEELWIDRRTLWAADVLKARVYKPRGGNNYTVDVYFKACDDEKLYGMGQRSIGYLDLKGTELELAHKNTQVNIPFVISTKGYGFIWNNPSIGRVVFAKNYTHWHAECTKQIDYLVIYGRTVAEIVQKYMELTGKPPLMPDWALGFWQGKLRYRNQDEVLQIVEEHKKRGLPLSVIFVDFFHWPKQGDWKFDKKYWPNPTDLVKELDAHGVKLMVSIWPTVELESENYQEMVRQGLLVRTKHGAPVLSTFRGVCSYCDMTNPRARSFIWEKVKNNYCKHGIKIFFLDEAEPEIDLGKFRYNNVMPYDYENLEYFEDNGLEVSNLYPYYYAKAFYDGLQSIGENEIANLIRCAWIGNQRFGIIVWSGDIPATFESLRQQIKAGLNMSLSGIFWWTTDVGGFLGGDPNDSHFRELVIRWAQFAVFSPIFRFHGFRMPHPLDYPECELERLTGGPNEVWAFGAEAYEILKKLLFLRERLKPYIKEQARKAHEDGVPIMRPLFFDFPMDETAYEVEDEYMFGPEILVAPVLYEGVRIRRVYLPKGAEWINPYTKSIYTGGEWIQVDAPLDTIPVFIKKEGAFLLNVFSAQH
ncbi:MAG: glycoside hydrolase family 31 protein [Nitrososphaerota archaeon]